MTFSASWLALREKHDRKARSPWVLRQVDTSAQIHQPRRVVDLGAGTGAMLRVLAPCLPKTVSWELVDLSAFDNNNASTSYLRSTGPVHRSQIDLAAELPRFATGDLVVASAFFDLVSGPWLDRLVRELDSHQLRLYTTLNVDGRSEFSPGDPRDGPVMAGFRRHQCETDKGFGFPLGPDAPRALADRLDDVGYEVYEDTSDWLTDDAALLEPLLVGIAEAARAYIASGLLASWLQDRLARIKTSKLTVRIGHRDLFAVPPSLKVGSV